MDASTLQRQPRRVSCGINTSFLDKLLTTDYVLDCGGISVLSHDVVYALCSVSWAKNLPIRCCVHNGSKCASLMSEDVVQVSDEKIGAKEALRLIEDAKKLYQEDKASKAKAA